MPVNLRDKVHNLAIPVKDILKLLAATWIHIPFIGNAVDRRQHLFAAGISVQQDESLVGIDLFARYAGPVVSFMQMVKGIFEHRAALLQIGNFGFEIKCHAATECG